MTAGIETVPTHTLVLRRCTKCKKINRVHPEHALTARCGACSGQLQLSHYDVLGVQETANPDAIRKAFHKSVLKWHPDKRPGDATAVEQFQSITRAYHVLRQPSKRTAYDQTELGRIHIQQKQQNTQKAAQKSADRKSAQTTTYTKAQTASTANQWRQQNATQRPPRSPGRADETVNSTKETVHLVATTSIMLVGVSLWALFSRNSGHTNPLLLWVALATGIYGVGKFLYVLSDLE